MKTIKIGQIGTKHAHARSIFGTLKKLPEQFTILGVAEPDPDRADFLKTCPTYQDHPAYSVEELLALPGLEAVTIETDEVNLSKYAIMAAQRGLHVFMDKPGGTDPAEFARLIQTIQDNGLVLSLGYMYRYNPMIRQLLAQVKAGELGQIISVEAQMNCHMTPQERAHLRTMPGGQMFYLGCHLVDLVLQLQGQPEAILPMNRATGLEGVDTTDFAMAALRYPQGISFVKTNGTEVGGYRRRQLVVCGTEKTVELKPLEQFADGGFTTTRTDFTDQNITTETSPVYHRYQAMLETFGQVIRGEIENPYPCDYELQLYETIIKCCEVSL